MLKIEIDDFGANVEIEENNIKQFKYLSIEKFMEAVLQKYNFNTGILPSGTIAYQKKCRLEKICILQSSGIRKVKYQDIGENNNPGKLYEFTVPMAALLWFYTLDDKHKLTNTKVNALKIITNTIKPVTPNTMLYSPPFSNVGLDGNICWGSDDELLEKPLKNLNGLITLPELFFYKPFNKDLDANLPVLIPNVHATLGFFRKFNRKKQFPYEILKEHKTFMEVWKND